MMLPNAVPVISEQMNILKTSGLLDEASEFHVGINDNKVTGSVITESLIPPKANITFHGLQCRNECRTIQMLEQWLPGHDDWYVLYFHSKSASHLVLKEIDVRWRGCMNRNVLKNWSQCVAALDEGYDIAGCHYMAPPATPIGQRIMAGTFWWSKAPYLKTLTPIEERDRIKLSGIDSIESRFEAEVKIGNSPVEPKVKDFHPGWNPSLWQTCNP